MCPLNELQLTSAQRRQSQRYRGQVLSEEAVAAAGAVAIWPKIPGRLAFWG
jgi:hypothetical protein